MTDIRKTNALADAFFSDMSLSINERTGLALLAAAKNTEVKFDRNVLPTVSTSIPGSGSSIGFSSGVNFDEEEFDKLIEQNPDDAERLKRQKVLIRAHNGARSELRGEKMQRLNEAGAMWGGGWGGHANPDYGRIIDLGTKGIREIIKKYRAINTETEAEGFYNSCEYFLDAMDVLGERFHEAAIEELKTCTDEGRRKRLELAAKAFENIPVNPAQNFTEACHVFWMTFTYDGIDSPGRFDQYMARPYANSTDKEEVADMLDRIWEAFHDTRSWNLCLSGSDENWNDDTNELTYDILKLAAVKKYQTPNITLRVHRNTPDKLWKQIAETLASGIGMPALYNDECVCPALEKIGIPPVHSHLYCMNGCNQIDIMGKSHMGLEDGEVSFGKCLEFALHDGCNAMSENMDMISIPTGDAREFKSYEEVEKAFLDQLDYMVHISTTCSNICQHKRATYEPNPQRSCLIDGCLEKGIDYRNGGPLYGHGQILAEGIADAGDSLYAIKKLVFEDKKYTMKQLIDALDANFEGYEELHRDFSNCDRFGNDIDTVDEVTVKILNHFLKTCKKHHTYRGGTFTGGCSPFSRAAYYGISVAALPHGKKKGDSMYADSIGAVPGHDTNGPTALLKSALKYNHIETGSGFILQVKYDKKLFNTDLGKEAFISMAKTYFREGGQQFTATVVSPEELLDAQKHPEKHEDLIVRVGGYSDYFVRLDEDLQNNVIARTLY